MSISSSKSKQFRPYLSPSELVHLLNLLKLSADAGDSTSRKLHSKLSIFAFKVDTGMVTPSYVSTPPLTALEKLGGTTPEEARYMNGEMSEEEETEYMNKLMNPTSPL